MATRPPITHYKDEVPEDNTQDILNQELDKEVEKNSTNTGESIQLKVLPVTKTQKKNPSNIVAAFRQKMSLNTTTVDLPSIGKSIEFKDIDTKEQKDLSKIAMENKSRADILYCTMLGMINRLCCEKGFEIRDYTEFERIAVTLNLQQMNKVGTEIKFTCPKCNKENVYKLDSAKLIRKFNKTYHTDIDFDVESNGKKYMFTIGWASVSKVEEFFKNYYKKYDGSSKATKEMMDNLSQIEYITMFIKKVSLADVSDPDDVIVADLNELPYGDRVQIIDALPQHIVFDENTGVVSKIIENFIKPLNDCFKYNDCVYCGAEQDGAMASVTDFMGL